jgi:hypothetical protein
MKRLFLLICVSMAAILGLAAFSWAQEASVFDSGEKIIIRAYIIDGMSNCQTASAPVTAGPYSACMEVRNAGGVVISKDMLNVTGTVLMSGTSTTNVTAAHPPSNPFQIHYDDLVDMDISMSIDNDTGIIYIFCRDDVLHVMQYNIDYLQPMPGTCGTPSGAPFATLPVTTSGLCSIGTASTPAVNTTTGVWTWSCAGINNGSTANGCSTTAKVNGVCGSASGSSFTSAPTTNLCNPGTASPAPSGAGPWTWSCAGLNGGTTATGCSASVQSTGTIDLDFTKSYGWVTGISTSGCTANNASCSVSVSIINNGTGSAGSFRVKAWVSSTSSPTDASAQLLGSWTVPGLAAGATASGTMSGMFTGLVGHAYYNLIVKIDADGQVSESNETNNTYYWAGIYVYR